MKLIIIIAIILIALLLLKCTNQNNNHYLEKGPKLAENKDIEALKFQTDKIILNKLVFKNSIGEYQKILELNDKKEILQLISCLHIKESKSPFKIRTIGNHQFKFYKEGKEISAIEYLEYDYIRWEPYWNNDAELIKKDILHFLNGKGIKNLLTGYEKEMASELIKQENHQKLLDIIPKSLHGTSFDIPQILKSLEEEIPNEEYRIRQLFKTLGNSTTSWTQYSVIEIKTERVLLSLPLSNLIQSIGLDNMDSETLDGMARFFLGYEFDRIRKSELDKIPKDLFEYMKDRKRENQKK